MVLFAADGRARGIVSAAAAAGGDLDGPGHPVERAIRLDQGNEVGALAQLDADGHAWRGRY